MTTARAASNIRTPMTNRSSGERPISCCRTSSAISGGVSLMRTFLPKFIQSQLARPSLDVSAVASSRNEVLHVAELQFGMRVLRPIEFGNDEVFLAHDPRLEVFNFDPLAAVEFRKAILVLFADDAVHLDDAFVVDQVEQRLVGDGTVHGFARNVVVGAEQFNHALGVAGTQRHDEVNVASHARLGVVIHRHRAGEHVADVRRVEFRGNVADDVELILHSLIYNFNFASVTAPSEALVTWAAYFARTPRV